MISKHGSEEAVREFMSQSRMIGRKNYKGTGGFAANKDLAREAGKKGAEKRWGNATKDNTNTKATNDAEGQVG